MSNLLMKSSSDHMLTKFFARQENSTASLAAITYTINGWKGELGLINNHHTLSDKLCTRDDLSDYASNKRVKDMFLVDRVASAVANAMPLIGSYDFVNGQWELSVGNKSSDGTSFSYNSLSDKLLDMGARKKGEWIICQASSDRVNSYFNAHPRLIQSWENPPTYSEDTDSSTHPQFNKLSDDQRLLDPINWWKNQLAGSGLDITRYSFEIVPLSELHTKDGSSDSLTIVGPGDCAFKALVAVGPRLASEPDIRFIRFAGRYGSGGDSGLDGVSTYISRSNGVNSKLSSLGFSGGGIITNQKGYKYESTSVSDTPNEWSTFNKFIASEGMGYIEGLWPVKVQRDSFDLGSDALNNLEIVPDIASSISFFGSNVRGSVGHERVSTETFAFHQRGFQEIKLSTAGITSETKSGVLFHHILPNEIKARIPMLAVDAYMRERLVAEKDPKIKNQLQQGIDKLQSQADAIITAKVHNGALPYPTLAAMENLEITRFASKGDVDILTEPLNDDGLTLKDCLARCDKDKSKNVLYHTFCLVNDERPTEELLTSENARQLIVADGAKLVISGTQDSPVFSGLLSDNSVLGLNSTDSKILFCYANNGLTVDYSGMSDGAGYDEIKSYFALTDEAIADIVDMDVMSTSPKSISASVRADFKALSASEFVDSAGYPFLYPAAADEYTRAVLAYKGVGNDPTGIVLALLFTA